MLRSENRQTVDTVNLSLKLSEVLADLGVNDDIVKMRRCTYLLREKLSTYYSNLVYRKQTLYHFGSQSEGTTTLGLGSDLDCLLCRDDVNIIQTYDEWKPDVTNLLVVQDEKTIPGYCFLQKIRNDAPVPSKETTDENFVMDKQGRVLLKNSVLCRDAKLGQVRHGPALMSKGRPNIETDDEGVYAYRGKTWPFESHDWVDKLENGSWPTSELIRHSEDTGFFVVPVGSKLGEMKDLEWRISTSMAERLLMFSLNITQIQCYVLLKMIIKSFVHPATGESISSFICKTTLFHCIDKLPSDIWTRERLVDCLTFCLNMLQGFVISENCPHFMSHTNNLLAGRYSSETKLELTEIFDQLLSHIERTLLGIPIDELGRKLKLKLNKLEMDIQPYSATTNFSIAGGLLRRTGVFVCVIGNMLDMDLESIADNSANIVKTLFVLNRCIRTFQAVSSEDKMAVEILNAIVMSKLAASLAVLNEDQSVGASVIDLFHLSVCYRSDIASNQLKFVSILYHSGDFTSVSRILEKLKWSYEFKVVESVCGCITRTSSPSTIRLGFMEKALQQNKENINDILKTSIAFCIRFVSSEEWMVPLELRHDMFKLVYEDMSKGKEEIHIRKTWAIVDSLTFLFFMQYKTYGKLGQREEKGEALTNLEKAIDREDNLGHRETALNLLGQCMEEEGRLVDALYCYLKSLQTRQKKNAAKVLICCCFAKLTKKQ